MSRFGVLVMGPAGSGKVCMVAFTLLPTLQDYFFCGWANLLVFILNTVHILRGFDTASP